MNKFLDFYKENLMGPDWGEQVGIYPYGNGFRMQFSMVASDLTLEEMEETWSPFTQWVQERPNDFSVHDWFFLSIPGTVMIKGLNHLTPKVTFSHIISQFFKQNKQNTATFSFSSYSS